MLFQGLGYNVGSVNMLSWPGMMSWVSVYFGTFFPSFKIMHCTFTVICGMQVCFWNLEFVQRVNCNVCCICRQGLEEQRNFWKSCWWKTAGNAQVQVIWDSYRSHDGCDFTVHGGNDTICHPGLTRFTHWWDCYTRMNVAFGQTPFGRMLTP